MTLIDCLKNLFKEDDMNPLSPEEMRVYMTLLKEWNRLGRPEWFEYSLIPKVIPKLLPNVLPKMVITRTREKLQKRGLIQYVSGNGRVKNPCYKICFVTKDVTKLDTKDDTKPKEKVSPIPPLKEIYSELREKERISKDIPKKDRESRINWEEFKKAFNESVPSSVPKIIDIKESRRQKVKSVISEYGEDAIRQVYEKINQSDFLSGRKSNPGRQWKCTFDFIFKKENFQKILEGNYDNAAHQTAYSDKRSVNNQVFQDFIAEREQRANGMAYEVEKPF